MTGLASVVCPYPGLRPFTDKEARYYFGRDTQRNECIQRLEQHRFLAIVGSSGAGKSSLVNAGILPEAKLGRIRGADENWRVAVMRPGPDPMTALARALAKCRDGVAVNEVDGLLRTSPRALADVAQMLGKNDSEPHSLLLVVDQFEETFRLGTEQQTPHRWFKERVNFVRAITSARRVAHAPVFVITTMRADFLQHCTRFAGLPDALNEGQYLVPQLTLDQLEDSLLKPLEQVEGIEARMSVPLLRRLLKDATALQDALPVVQHAVMRTWLEWRRRVPAGSTADPKSEIDLADYERAGTTLGAIDMHGDEIVKGLAVGLGGDRAELLTKLMFQRLTLSDADGRVTRSPKSLAQLTRLAESRCIDRADEGLRRVIEAFRDDGCRFLMPPPNEPLEDGTEIDISHEAVFREWDLLAGERVADTRTGGWIAEEYDYGRTYVRLVESARLRSSKRGQLLSDELFVHTDNWWQTFKPNAEWASRYHVLDQAAENILKEAQATLEQCEREEARGADPAARDAGYEKYRNEFKSWHQQQFDAAQALLKASTAAIKAGEEARRAAEEAIQAAALDRKDAEIARKKAEVAEQREEAAKQREEAAAQREKAAAQQKEAAEQRERATAQEKTAAEEREKAARAQSRLMRLFAVTGIGAAIATLVVYLLTQKLGSTEKKVEGAVLAAASAEASAKEFEGRALRAATLAAEHEARVQKAQADEASAVKLRAVAEERANAAKTEATQAEATLKRSREQVAVVQAQLASAKTEASQANRALDESRQKQQELANTTLALQRNAAELRASNEELKKKNEELSKSYTEKLADFLKLRKAPSTNQSNSPSPTAD